MRQEVEQDENTEVKSEQDMGQVVEQDIKDEFNDSHFSAQRSPVPRIAPGSATSECSGSSLDSDYQEFCCSHDAFLAQCCRLSA